MLSFKRHRFPPAIITSSIWLYARFTLSLRDVEEVFAERGLDVSYETVRRWVLKFGSTIAANLRRARPKPSDHWHLDEMAVFIRGQQHWLWRAVNNEGEVLDFVVQRRRDAKVAAKLMKKLLKRYGIRPSLVVTDKLRSYRCASRNLGLGGVHRQGSGPTIALRTRISPSDDASAKCSASNRSVQPSAFWSSTPRPTTPSTTNVTFCADPTTSTFDPEPSRPGLRCPLLSIH